SDGGAWYRLDPTPGRELNIAAKVDSIGNRLAQAFDYVELLWRDYVLGLNTNRQEDLVYDPLTARMAILPSWIESRTVSRWLRRLSSQFGLDFLKDHERGTARAFEGALAAFIIVGLVVLLALVQLLRAAAWTLGRWRRANVSLAAARPPEFYRRLERVLARMPLIRRHGQTPQELAAAAQGRLDTVPTAA